MPNPQQEWEESGATVNIQIGPCQHSQTFPFHNTTNGERGSYCVQCGAILSTDPKPTPPEEQPKEPRFVDQTKFGYPEGNCFAACVASILGIPIEDCPTVIVTKDFDRTWREWLARRGLGMVDVPSGTGEHIAGMCIAFGKSPRGGETASGHPVTHAVVCRDMELVHDPHPSRAFLDGRPDGYTVFYNLNRPPVPSVGSGEQTSESHTAPVRECGARINVSHRVTGHGFGYGTHTCELEGGHIGFHKLGQITWDAAVPVVPASDAGEPLCPQCNGLQNEPREDSIERMLLHHLAPQVERLDLNDLEKKAKAAKLWHRRFEARGTSYTFSLASVDYLNLLHPDTVLAMISQLRLLERMAVSPALTSGSGKEALQVERLDGKPICPLCVGSGRWKHRDPSEAEIKRGQELAAQYGLLAMVPDHEQPEALRELATLRQSASVEPERSQNHHGWYMANHARLRQSYQNQREEPPFTDIYIFSEAAWHARDAEVAELRAERDGARMAFRSAVDSGLEWQRRAETAEARIKELEQRSR